MKNLDLFSYQSFSEFLSELARSRGKRGGMKRELADVMGSHPAYLSRVLVGKAQLSLEQAERIASYLKFSEDETRYLLFLLQEERGGTAAVKKVFRNERRRILETRGNIKNRIPRFKQITREEQAVYYSAWYYQAIHVLVSIPKFRDLESLCPALGLAPGTVRDAVAFLEKTGIIRREGARWVAGETHLHLERDSPFIRQHHANWRMKAIHSLERARDQDLRYSAAFSLSEKDALQLKEKMLLHLQEYLETVKVSKEEKAYAFGMDFFEL